MIICTVSVNKGKFNFEFFQLFLEELLREFPYLFHQLENMDSNWGNVLWVKDSMVYTKLFFFSIIQNLRECFYTVEQSYLI